MNEITDLCLECGCDLTIYRMKKDYPIKTKFCDMGCKSSYNRKLELRSSSEAERWAIIGINSSTEAMEEITEMYK